jgi:hypothetical protein
MNVSDLPGIVVVFMTARIVGVRIGVIGRMSHRSWGNDCRSFGLQAISGQKVQKKAAPSRRAAPAAARQRFDNLARGAGNNN